MIKHSKINGLADVMVLTGTILFLIFMMTVPGCRKPEKKAYIIGIVNPNPRDKEIVGGFQGGMSRYGYEEGKNTTYILCENKETLDADIRNMLKKKVDLIFAVTTPGALAVKKETEGTDIPVVFMMFDAADSGVVKSLVSPGTRFTGVQVRGSTQKSLEWLRQMVPKAKHIYIPICFDTKAAELSIDDVKQFTSRSGMKLTVADIKNFQELQSSLASIPRDVDAIVIPHSLLVLSHLESVVHAAAKRRLPTVSSGHEEFRKGVLITYGQKQVRTGEQVARLAHSIFRGTPPGSLPVETADFFLAINLKTATALGLKISDDILQQTDIVVR